MTISQLLAIADELLAIADELQAQADEADEAMANRPKASPATLLVLATRSAAYLEAAELLRKHADEQVAAEARAAEEPIWCPECGGSTEHEAGCSALVPF